MVGIVVSNPTARNTTGRAGACGPCRRAPWESRPAFTRPVPVSDERDRPEEPGTFSMSPKVATTARPTRRARARCRHSRRVSRRPGSPAPRSGGCSRGSREWIPCFRSSTVCVPQTSMSRTSRPMPAAVLSISATSDGGRARLSSLIRRPSLRRAPRACGTSSSRSSASGEGEGLDRVPGVDDDVVTRLRVLEQRDVDLHLHLSLGDDGAPPLEQLLYLHRSRKTHRHTSAFLEPGLARRRARRLPAAPARSGKPQIPP